MEVLSDYRIAYLDYEKVCSVTDEQLEDITKVDGCEYYSIPDFIIAFNEEYITDLGIIQLVKGKRWTLEFMTMNLVIVKN